jgi:hypothetical protein
MAQATQESEHIVKTTVSFPEDLLEAGKKKAKSERRAFSAHLQWLLERDIYGPAGRPESSTQEVGA